MVVEGVFGLDDRQQAYPHFRILGPVGADGAGNGGIVAAAIEPHAAAGVTPPQLAKAYQFPSGVDGTGECIAIIELGGGFRRTDLTAYFASLGIPAPTVSSVSVDGGRNQPSTADSADGEVMLDIEVAAAIAPKARIAVYFAPNTDRGFLDAITRAVHDTQTEAFGHLDQLGRGRERLDSPGDEGHGPGLRRRRAAGRERAGSVRRRRVR